MTVTVETTPWGDFQTKAFTEFNAQGRAYDMVVGDSQWLGAASTAGHYVDLTDFVTANNVDRPDGSGDDAVLRRVPGQFRQVLVDPARKATPSAGPIARTGSRTRPRWPTSRR